MPTKSTCTRMDAKRKAHIDPKGPKQRYRLKQLQTHNVPTDDVEMQQAQIRDIFTIG